MKFSSRCNEVCHHIHKLMLAVFWYLALPYKAPCQVLVIPQSQRLAYSGGTTDFECISASQLTIQSIEWQINGSLFDDSAFDSIEQALLRLEGSSEIRGASLTVTNTPVEYNATTVRCIVRYATGSNETSGITLLLIQGTLDSVELMVFVSENSEIFLNWTAPFTLLGASDITYCVRIADSTNRRTLLSECGTTMTQFTSFLPLSFACEEHSFSVTPVNVVGNGTTNTVMLTNHSSVPMTSPELNEVIPLSTGFLLIMSAPVCDVELTLEDVDTGDTITLENTDVTITGANITFSTQQLRVKRNYSVTIIASNIAGNATSKTYICIKNLVTASESPPQFDSESEPKLELGNFTLTIGLIGGLAILVLLAIIQSVVIVILCCKKRQKAPVQLGAQNLQLYEEVRDPEPTTSSAAIVRRTSSRELAVPVPQYEDITLPEGVATKSGDPYQITQCPAYACSVK